MTALYRADATATLPAQWSAWGYLRRTEIPGVQATYALENRQGQVLLYATTQQGFTLKDYVGRPVCLYGPISYRSDDYLRSRCMTVQHVAVPGKESR